MELDIFPAPQEMKEGNMGQQQTLLHHPLGWQNLDKRLPAEKLRCSGGDILA